MVRQSVRLTADDLLRLPDDEQRSELVRGELRQMPPAGGEHGSLVGNLHILVGSFVRGAQLGVTFAAETGFVLRQDPDTVRAPDIAFVRRERLSEGPIPKGYLPFAPDLAVEVISPSETAEEVQEKVTDYLAAGSRMVWLVYPRSKTIAVHTPEGVRTLSRGDVLDGGDVLPGFQAAAADIFAEQ